MSGEKVAVILDTALPLDDGHAEVADLRNDSNGKTAYVVVNPEDEEIEFKIAGQEYKCPALDGVLVLL